MRARGFEGILAPPARQNLFNLGRFSNRSLGMYAGANYSYRIPYHRLIDGEPFELPVDISQACGQDILEVLFGRECKMGIGSESGDKIRFWPMFVEFDPDNVCPELACGPSGTTVKVHGPPSTDFQLEMVGVEDSGGHRMDGAF